MTTDFLIQVVLQSGIFAMCFEACGKEVIGSWSIARSIQPVTSDRSSMLVQKYHAQDSADRKIT